MKSTVLQGLPNILDQIKNYKTPTTIALPKLPSKQITQHMQQKLVAKLLSSHLQINMYCTYEYMIYVFHFQHTKIGNNYHINTSIKCI